MTSNPYVILDFETTGLDRNRAYPLEVAAIVLTPALDVVGEFERVLLDARSVPQEVCEPGAMELHAKNGLIAAITRGEGISIEQARDDLAEFLMRTKLETRAIMIGNLPDFDRSFLRRFFPEVDSGLHYRMIDVSSIRELAAMRSGLTTNRLKAAVQALDATGSAPHRALADCRFALAELRLYAASFDGARLLETLRASGVVG